MDVLPLRLLVAVHNDLNDLLLPLLRCPLRELALLLREAFSETLCYGMAEAIRVHSRVIRPASEQAHMMMLAAASYSYPSGYVFPVGQEPGALVHQARTLLGQLGHPMGTHVADDVVDSFSPNELFVALLCP